MPALFGGTETQVSGPTGPMTVVSAMVIASAIEISGSLQAGMGIIIASFFLAGGFQILYGLFKTRQVYKVYPLSSYIGFHDRYRSNNYFIPDLSFLRSRL